MIYYIQQAFAPSKFLGEQEARSISEALQLGRRSFGHHVVATTLDPRTQLPGRLIRGWHVD